eukprot:IDg7329t1
MGHERSFSKEEVAVVKALARQNLSIRDIAKEANRTKTAVQNIIQHIGKTTNRRIPRRPSNITPAFRRVVVRAARRDDFPARTLVEQHKLLVGFRRVQKMLQNAAYLERTRMGAIPKLKPWNKEQKLSGLMGKCTYLQTSDTSKAGRLGSKDMSCFVWLRKPDLEFLSNNLNTEGYCQVLDDVLVLWVEKNYAGEWRFQHENADSGSLRTKRHHRGHYYGIRKRGSGSLANDNKISTGSLKCDDSEEWRLPFSIS